MSGIMFTIGPKDIKSQIIVIQYYNQNRDSKLKNQLGSEFKDIVKKQDIVITIDNTLDRKITLGKVFTIDRPKISEKEKIIQQIRPLVKRVFIYFREDDTFLGKPLVYKPELVYKQIDYKHLEENEALVNRIRELDVKNYKKRNT